MKYALLALGAAALASTALTGLAQAETLTISSPRQSVVEITARYNTFINNSVITAYGVPVFSDVDLVKFSNLVEIRSLGTSQQGNDGGGVSLHRNVDTFDNSGIIKGVTGTGVNISGTTQSFINSGTIYGGTGGISIDGNVAGVFNNDRGTITGAAETGVYIAGTTKKFTNSGTITGWGDYNNGFFGVGAGFNGAVESFTNSGTISGNWGAVSFDAGVTSFRNEASGKLFGATQSAAGFNGPVGSFTNYGTISGLDWNGVHFNMGVTTFRNEKGGWIEGTTESTVGFDGGDFGSFYNAGTIILRADARIGRSGLSGSGNIGSFVNDTTGVITASNPYGAAVRTYGGGVIGSFVNGGTLISNDATGVGAEFAGTAATTFLNTSTGIIKGGYAGVLYWGGSASFVNEGQILGTGSVSGGLSFQNGVIENRKTGVISGVTGGIGIDAEHAGSATIINAGVISGGTYGITYAYLPNNAPEVARDDVLRLLPGSTITGLVDFGQGNDLLDLSKFEGTAALNIANLETITLPDGTTQDYGTFKSKYADGVIAARDGNKFTIMDAETVTTAAGGGGGGVASSAAAVTTEVANIISDQLSGLAATNGPDLGEPSPNLSAYAPRQQSAGEQAVLSALDVTREHGPTIWASGFGGGAQDLNGSGLATLYGGIVVGSHARVDQVTVGLLGGFVRSQLHTGAQVVATATGLAGAYAQTNVGVVRLDGSLLAGYNLHDSARDSGGGGIATAAFGSWFLAPEAALTLPVLTNDQGELNVAFRAKYVGGMVNGYTETGALANLTLGDQQISLLDLRLEANGRYTVDAASRTVFSAKGGVFGQSNLGGSTMQMAVLGNAFEVVSPGTLEYGVYGGAGLSMAVGEAVDAAASVNASVRSDGLFSATLKAQLTGQF